MRLIVGGAHQGKLAYALEQTELSAAQVVDGAECDLSDVGRIALFTHFHLAVRRLLQAGENPLQFVERLLACNPDIVILADEVGCGVVPLSREERDWREAAGRACCELARRASRVDRVFCGIAVTIKGATK